MRTIVLDGPGPPGARVIRDIPVPEPATGWVLIRVRAFGLNRSELHMRLGLAQGVTFPRVPSIEAVGVVAECPGGEFTPGQQVAALMGGMGRAFDGGYASTPACPSARWVPFRSALDWACWERYRRCCRPPTGPWMWAWTRSPGSPSWSAAERPRSGWSPRSWPNSAAWKMLTHDSTRRQSRAS